MADKQSIYTGALNALGGRKSLTSESTEATRVLDDHYDEVIRECLAAGSWNFGTDFVKMDGDTGLITYQDTGSVGHGKQYGFTKPDGWVRTHAVSGDDLFTYPLLDYVDENTILKAEYVGPIYMRYVDTGPGLNLANWTDNFRRYVQLELAARVAYRLTSSASLEERIEKKRDKAKRTALNQDAMDEANPKFAPPGSWTQARWGRSAGRNRTGNSLTG